MGTTAAPHSSLEIRLLGPFRITIDGVTVDDARWERPKAKQLMKLLAMQPFHQLHREQAMDALWPGMGVSSAANNLNKALHFARRALEPGRGTRGSSFVVTDGAQIRLQAPSQLWIDVDEFERRAAESARSSEPPLYERALRLYEGDLLVEDLYENWTAPRREQLRAMHRDLLLRLAKVYDSRAEHDRAIASVEALIARDPFHEEAHRMLIHLLAVTGARNRAIERYREFEATLDREVGSEPEKATRDLYRQIVAGEIGTAAIDSIAVLPFANVNGGEDLEYLSDGISEGIVQALARIANLRVLAWNSAVKLKGRTTTPHELGREIGVDAVVGGRIVHLDSMLQVSAELVKVADGSHLWGETLTHPLTGLITVADSIGQSIADRLRKKIGGAMSSPSPATESREAFHEYLKGRYHFNRMEVESIQKALAHFQRAIHHDPCYAAAYAGLSDSYAVLS